MDIKQIIEIIKKNPQLNYDELKRQAVEIGVPLDTYHPLLAFGSLCRISLPLCR